MNRKILFTVLGFVFALQGVSDAKELTSFYRGIRPLGMGDAFTAIADDSNAVFYNPAGLNSIEDGDIEILNPTFGYSQNTMDFVKDIQDLDTSNTAASTAMLRRHMGKFQQLRVSVFPNWTKHNFSVGALVQAKVDGSIHNPPYPYLDVDVSVDAGVVAGVARAFGPDSRLQAGISGKFIQRRGISRTYTATDIANENYDVNSDLKSGSGIGGNVGAIYNLAILPSWSPSVGLAVQNVGGMRFGSDQAEVKQKVNFGLAAHRKIGFGELTLAMDFKDVFFEVGEDNDKAKRLHLGGELKLSKMFAFRAGINQGYGTFGATIDFWLIKASYALYYEEVGSYAGQIKDQRHVFQVSLGF